jgi:hypothetical protein
MPQISDVSEQVLKDIIITSLIVRTTGRVEHLREYLEFTSANSNGVSWKRMFNESDCRFLPLFIAASSGDRDSAAAYIKKGSMTAWLTDQLKESLPSAVRLSPKSYSMFLTEFVKHLNGLIRSIKTGELRKREEMVKKVFLIMRESNVGDHDKNSKLMFMSHQLVSDLEEVTCGNDGDGTSPFVGNFICAGYGGQQGFIALDHSQLMDKECKGVGYKSWNSTHSPQYMLEACQNLKQHVENELDDVHLSLLGLEKVGGLGVVIRINGRRLGLTDMEHMLCKVYLACTRTRGSRNHGASRAWRNYCWPSKKADTVGNPYFVRTVTESMLLTYEKAIAKMSGAECDALSSLDHPFSDL